MQATAKIVCDSMNSTGVRLTTLQLRYPRIIHAELMTHRVFSRNASSSRAIPVKKMLEQVRTAPAMPARFGGNKPGMQDTGEELYEPVVIRELLVKPFKIFLLEQADVAEKDVELMVTTRSTTGRLAYRFGVWLSSQMSESLMNAGYHKQVANRLTEAGQFISVVVTATEWSNWFALRNHDAADPTIHELAQAMQAAFEVSIPTFLGSDKWHLPYVRKEEMINASIDQLLMLSTARCARVSYLTHEGKAPDVQSDLTLYDRLVGSNPKHMSPTEHQAFATPLDGMTSNLQGWTQYRKFVELGVVPSSVYEEVA